MSGQCGNGTLCGRNTILVPKKRHKEAQITSVSIASSCELKGGAHGRGRKRRTQPNLRISNSGLAHRGLWDRGMPSRQSNNMLSH